VRSHSKEEAKTGRILRGKRKNLRSPTSSVITDRINITRTRER
jgi:hypothetical protein